MDRLTQAVLLCGALMTMALSNAVVPVLNQIASDAVLQGAVYSAYFLGAFLMVVPAGWLSDKIGRRPLIRAGLAGTAAAAVLLWVTYPEPAAAVLLRCVEGVCTGMFVAAAMAQVNSAREHKRLSGEFVALMNIGMVAGLILSGWGAAWHPYAGVVVFGAGVVLAAVLSLGIRETAREDSGVLRATEVGGVIFSHVWLWFAMFSFCGATGVVISLYPDLSGFSADGTGMITALMSIATAVCVYAASRFSYFDSLSILRTAGVVMALSVPVVLITPLGMISVGAVFGVITVAILNYLAETRLPQGVMNGLFTMTQYAGMAFLPFGAGLLLTAAGYLPVFFVTAALVLAAGLLVVRCPCYVR